MDEVLLTPVVSGIEDSFLIVSTQINDEDLGKLSKNEDAAAPEIYEMQVDSKVTNRYARTLVTSKVKNANPTAKEATFSVILPDKAFISEFVMEIAGKSYKAYVKEKEEAKDIYDQAVASGRSAGHVAVSARETNRFTVSVNIDAYSKAIFLLTYEELLKRKEDMYELVINVHLQQPVKELCVTVLIEESKPLKFVRTPPFRSGNEIIQGVADLDPKADINRVNSTTSFVKFVPSIKRQKELATNLGTVVNEGLSGQFVVQYDVERDPNGGEVLVQDGYFVHFFAPSDVKPLNKFIIFVLDTSGSMDGQKMRQLKQAMNTILDQLSVNDSFHIVTFNSFTKVWTVQESHLSAKIKHDEPLEHQDLSYPKAFPGLPDSIQFAKDVMLELDARGGTNIYEALEVALCLVKREQEANENSLQPIIMFLTDGEPTTGVTSLDRIVSDITNYNTVKASIYSLSFGEDADRNFLKRLSQKNRGFSRHIYEAADAALQLNNFYKEIASPLLSEVRFEYVPETTRLTITQFPIYFGGSEIVVSGKIDADDISATPKITGRGLGGPVAYIATVQKTATSLERLWAYLTVQQLLDEMDIGENKAVNEKEALDLSLKYSFVTPVSSLVVVKPDSIDFGVSIEAADKVAGPNFGISLVCDMPEEVTLENIKKKVIKKRAFKKTCKYSGIIKVEPSVEGNVLDPAPPVETNSTKLGDRETASSCMSNAVHEDGFVKSAQGPTMSLEDQFNKAADDVKNLKTLPSDEDLLELHALFQQATAGDVNKVCPDPSDLEAKAKWNAWAAKKGTSKEEAQKKYIEKVAELIASIGLK